jgi:integrase
MRVNLNTVLRKLNRTDYSVNTKNRYQWVIADFLSNSGGVLDQRSIDIYLTKGSNSSTISALRLLADVVNVSIKFPVAERNKVDDILTVRQVEDLMKALPLPYNLMVGLIYSGLKTNEVLDLRPEDISDKGVLIDDIVIDVGPLLDKLKIVKAYTQLDPRRNYLFSPDGKEPYHNTSLSKVIRSVGISLGIEDCNSHVIRRSFAVHAIQQGKDISTIGCLMGITNMRPYVRMAESK